MEAACADKPKLKGVDAVRAAYGVDVIINGNQCFANNGVPLTDHPYPFGIPINVMAAFSATA